MNHVAAYPSKTFVQVAKQAFSERENLTVLIVDGWKKRLIEREIDRWVTSMQHLEEVSQKTSSGMIYSMFACRSLMSMHHFAIAHGYQMSFKKTDGLTIFYEFLST